MINIPPRLNVLLKTLLKASEPVSVEGLSTRFEVSRRTVFRDLKSCEGTLREFQLTLATKTGKGMVIEGKPEDREKLLAALEERDRHEPAGKQERQLRLALCLLAEREFQKLFYYARKLGVSESTISSDLDSMEGWFRNFRLEAERRQSIGVRLRGREGAIRRFLISLEETRLNGALAGELYFDRDLWTAFAALPETVESLCSFLTPESKEDLRLYLMTALQRIRQGFEMEKGEETAADFGLAEKIAGLLSSEFRLSFSRFEIASIAFELSACRVNTVLVPNADDIGGDGLKNLAYQMIERYDPSLSAFLKLDEILLNGLVFHLRSALVRMENRVELHDVMYEQIADKYPTVMEKTKRAAQLIKDRGGWLPESEISFLAMHFASAVHRLEERNVMKRTVRIGVLCVNGFGTSYLLAAQLEKYLGALAEVEIIDQEDYKNSRRYALLVSTAAIEASEVPVVVTPPYIDDGSLRRIREIMDRTPSLLEQTEPEGGEALAEVCFQLKQLSEDTARLLEGIQVELIENDCSFEQLAKLAGQRFGEGEESARLICEALTAREMIATQVIPELKLVLLHSQTEGVSGPVFSVIGAKGGHFSNPYFQGAKACVVMLLPKGASLERCNLMGSISMAFAGDEDFLQAVLACDREGIIRKIRRKLKEFLRLYVNSV